MTTTPDSTPDAPHAALVPRGLDVARIEVVSFDLDGTLIDSRTAWRDGFAAPFARLAERYPALHALGDSAHVHDHVFQPTLLELWERVRGEWSPDYVRDGWLAVGVDQPRRHARR